MHQELILNHLKQLIECYPQTDDQAAVAKALEYCKNTLKDTGSFKDLKLHTYKGFHSLTASTQNTKSPRLLLEAHIDVVPATELSQAHLGQDDQILTGRGAYDMLYATACYLAFAEEHRSDLAQLDIGLMITGDEEIGGLYGVEYLVKQGYGAGVCFLPDAGDRFGELSTAAKGVYNFDLVVSGTAHHGSRPWEGDGAANKLVKLLYELLQAFDDSDKANSTLTITCLNCGDSVNRGPYEATAHLDIRHADTADFQRIKSLLDSLCKQYDATIKNVLVAADLTLDTTSQPVQEFLALYEKHALKPITFSKAHGSSDARFFIAKNIPVIMLRPDGSGAHGDGESLSLDSLNRFYCLLEEYSLKFAAL